MLSRKRVPESLAHVETKVFSARHTVERRFPYRVPLNRVEEKPQEEKGGEGNPSQQSTPTVHSYAPEKEVQYKRVTNISNVAGGGECKTVGFCLRERRALRESQRLHEFELFLFVCRRLDIRSYFSAVAVIFSELDTENNLFNCLLCQYHVPWLLRLHLICGLNNLY